MSDLLNMTERTSERIASLEAQIEELRLLMLKNMENDNSFLSENVEPLPIGSGGGGGGHPQCFDISAKDEEQGLENGDIINRQIIAGGVLIPVGAIEKKNIGDFPNKIVGVKCDKYYGTFEITGYDDYEAVLDAQENGDVAIIPLYSVGEVKTDPDSGAVLSYEIKIDYRNIPHLDTWLYYT